MGIAGHDDQLFHGDALDLLHQLPDDAVDFIVTSPPYADNRGGALRWCSH